MKFSAGLVAMAMIVFPVMGVAADKKSQLACEDNLHLANATAKEYYDKRDQAEREKIAYKTAFETEQRVRKSLETQIADLKKKLEPKADEKKAD